MAGVVVAEEQGGAGVAGGARAGMQRVVQCALAGRRSRSPGRPGRAAPRRAHLLQTLYSGMGTGVWGLGRVLLLEAAGGRAGGGHACQLAGWCGQRADAGTAAGRQAPPPLAL